MTRAASGARVEPEPGADEAAGAASSRDAQASPGAAGAMGLAALRRQLATVQMHLAEAQGQLAREQQGRAEDADALAVMLERVARSERAMADAAELRIELEREREFVEELRVSVREKYDDGNALRQRLADAETLLATKTAEAADRHAWADRAALLESQLDEANKERAAAVASEEARRGELAALSAQLEDLRRAHGPLEAELHKANAALKSANMKTFAANKQLEAWKSESQRTIEQTRVEQQGAIDALRIEVTRSNSAVATLEKQLADAVGKLEALTMSLATLSQAERDVDRLREQTARARRSADEQLEAARKALASTTDVPVSSSRLTAAPPVTPTVPGFAATPPPAPSAAANRAKRPPPPPRPEPSAKRIAEGSLHPPDKADEAPSLEIGETEMQADDLVAELLEAKNRP